MSYFLISILLISINCQNEQMPEKWKLNEIWTYFFRNISHRNSTSHGLFDPNGYIRSKTGKQFEDYLDYLNYDSGISMFFIIIKKFDEDNVTQKYVNVTSLRFFNELLTTKFDINMDKLVTVIYSVEDKRYKINVGKDYRHKTNARMVNDVFELVESYLEEQKPFLVIISIATKIEAFKNLNPADDEEEEEEKLDDSEYDDVRIIHYEKEYSDSIKYNDSNKLFSLFLILLLITLFIIFVVFFILKRNKRFKKSKLLSQKYLEDDFMNSQYEY